MLNSMKRKTSYFLQLILLASLCSVALANDSKISIRERKKAEVLDKILANGYDVRSRPPGANGTDGPVVVRVSTSVRTTPNIDVNKQEYSVDLTFREQWVDERLKFDDNDTEDELKYLSLTSAERIWKPASFFSNEKQSHFHNALMPNEYLRIYPKGDISHSIRISLTLDCPMNLEHYPFDRQECEFRVASYGYTSDDVVFLWREADPLGFSSRINLQGFTLVGYTPDYCPTKSIAPEYSCLKATFSFKRDLMPYLIRIYIPNFVLVLTSWVSFWLDPNSVAARVFLGTSTLLGTVLQIMYSNTSVPAVSYIKAVDIWTGVCMLFTFFTLLEFATLNYASRYNVKGGQADGISQSINDESEDSTTKRTSHYKHFMTWMFSRSKKIDVVSRIVFPVAFALFNLAYWITYLTPNE